jgi:hypothetical protein
MDKFDQIPEFSSPYWLLFDLSDPDPEHYSLARKHSDVVRRLSQEMARAQKGFRVTATRDQEKTYPE